MRKLKLQVQMSVDGFIAGPNGEMDWMEWNWDQELKDYVASITSTVDTIVLGRKLAQGFIPYWQTAVLDKENPVEGAEAFAYTPKVVFTKTLDKSEWETTVLATGNLMDEINKLKQSEGRDIIAYGGANFVSNLIQAGLIDEFHLFINPTAIGSGLSIFQSLNNNQPFQLLGAKAYDCGIVVLQYVLK